MRLVPLSWLVLRAAVALVGLFAAAAVAPAQAELRGVWVARDGLVSRAKILSTLDQLAAANINMVAVNVWSRGFTIHPSDVLFAACGQRQDPTFVGRDPLAEFVVEAHRRGIEVEAWFEYGFMLGWSGWYAGPTGVGPVLTANPAWIARDQTGNSQVSDGNGGFFTWAIHEHPAVRQFLLDLATELVDRYDVDGVQFDRVRYPSTSFGYDAVTSAAYQAATNQSPPTNPDQAQWKAWRAARLTAFHGDLYAAVKARRPSVRVSDAPTVMPGAYDTFLQDWPSWIANGSLDLVYPQVYRTTVSSYTATLDQQLAYLTLPLRAKVAPGIRAISGTPTSEVLGMVAADRVRSLPGHVFWYAEGLYDDLPALTANYFQAPAAVPLQVVGWRPSPVDREESDPTTAITGFLNLAVNGSHGGHAAIAPPTATAADHVQFQAPVPTPGLYRVQVHVPAGGGYAAAAPHRVTHAAGTTLVALDENGTDAGGWHELGTYWGAASGVAVDIGAVPGAWSVADAVSILPSRFQSGAMAVIGSGTTGSGGLASLALAGRACLGGELRLQAAALAGGAPLAWAIGFTPAATPMFGGTLLLLPTVTEFALANATGRADRTLPVPFLPAFHGLPLRAQVFALDATAIGGVVLTNAVATSLP